MKRVIFFILLYNFFHLEVKSQNSSDVHRVADQLYASGLFREALHEYQRLLFFEDSLGDLYNAKMALCSYQLKEYKNAYDYYRAAEILSDSDSLAAEFRFFQAEMQIRNLKYNDALSIIHQTQVITGTLQHRKKIIYTAFIHLLMDDYLKSEYHFNEYFKNYQSCIRDQFNSEFKKQCSYIKRVKPDLIYFSSFLLPGLGQSISGKPLSGLNSLALNGGIIFLIYRVYIIYDPITAIVSLSSALTRYYQGGANNAKKFALVKKDQRKLEAIKKLSHLIETSLCN